MAHRPEEVLDPVVIVGSIEHLGEIEGNVAGGDRQSQQRGQVTYVGPSSCRLDARRLGRLA